MTTDITMGYSGESRGSNKAIRNVVRQITKFGMIVFCKIVINIWI